MTVQLVAGCHQDASDLAAVRVFIEPLFTIGTIPLVPGAQMYYIAYEDLCAADSAGQAFAVWSKSCPEGVGDIKHYDIKDIASGNWEPI